jgi:hypothetical protein
LPLNSVSFFLSSLVALLSTSGLYQIKERMAPGRAIWEGRAVRVFFSSLISIFRSSHTVPICGSIALEGDYNEDF